MTDCIQIVTATGSEEEAERIAAALVEARLAACVQVLGPITSTYRWHGAVESAREWLCVVKAPAALYERVERAIRELHSYETPEIIALPILAGSADYLSWCRAETTDA